MLKTTKQQMRIMRGRHYERNESFFFIATRVDEYWLSSATVLVFVLAKAKMANELDRVRICAAELRAEVSNSPNIAVCAKGETELSICSEKLFLSNRLEKSNQ